MRCGAIKKHYKSTLSVQQQYATLGIISKREVTMSRLFSNTRGHSRATLEIQTPGNTLDLYSLGKRTMLRLFSASKEPSKLILRNMVN